MKAQVKIVAVLLSAASFAALADIVVPITLVDDKGIGAAVGQVTISESPYGLVFSRV